MKSLGKGKLSTGTLNHRPKAKPVAPRCKNCVKFNSTKNFCNKHEINISDVEDISEMTIHCFEPVPVTVIA
jgi:hypothetical protein